MFSAEHVWNSQSTIYLKSHGWVHGFQHEVLLINFSTMFCLTCALSRNRSLQDAIPPGHLFVWFTKHCLAKHCLSVRGDADKCEKQFCFVFRICLVFYDVPLRWALACLPLRREDVGSRSGQVIPKTILKIVQTAYLHDTLCVRVGVWQYSPTV